jgi:hypothetical protein
MKNLMMMLFVLMFSSNTFAQKSNSVQPDPNKKLQLVEASCGQCKFKMKGKGCTLAVRINGKAYFVDKSDIEAHGDAHAKMGFCNAIRKAKVQGEVVNGKFVASYFKLIDIE